MSFRNSSESLVASGILHASIARATSVLATDLVHRAFGADEVDGVDAVGGGIVVNAVADRLIETAVVVR
jgi:hypothetical protein